MTKYSILSIKITEKPPNGDWFEVSVCALLDVAPKEPAGPWAVKPIKIKHNI